MKWSETMEKAHRIGAEKGRDAASWVFDGNTPEEAYRRTLAGIQDGDPETLDSLPSSPLSGEWADSYSIRDLADDLDIDAGDVGMDEACTAFEDGFSGAVMLEVERLALEHLRED